MDKIYKKLGRLTVAELQDECEAIGAKSEKKNKKELIDRFVKTYTKQNVEKKRGLSAKRKKNKDGNLDSEVDDKLNKYLKMRLRGRYSKIVGPGAKRFRSTKRLNPKKRLKLDESNEHVVRVNASSKNSKSSKKAGKRPVSKHNTTKKSRTMTSKPNKLEKKSKTGILNKRKSSKNNAVEERKSENNYDDNANNREVQTSNITSLGSESIPSSVTSMMDHQVDNIVRSRRIISKDDHGAKRTTATTNPVVHKESSESAHSHSSHHSNDQHSAVSTPFRERFFTPVKAMVRRFAGSGVVAPKVRLNKRSRIDMDVCFHSLILGMVLVCFSILGTTYLFDVPASNYKIEHQLDYHNTTDGFWNLCKEGAVKMNNLCAPISNMEYQEELSNLEQDFDDLIHKRNP